MRHIFSIAAALLAATGAHAQHAGHGTPYAAFAQRDIKALSAQDREGLLEGRGMTLALPAELNGYPGPLHVLEHADALALDARQREATAQLMQSHKAEARALGAQVVDAERALDRAFASRTATPEGVAAHTQRIAQLQARLRASHLETHLAQTALLAPQQVAKYQVLRGYAQAPATHRSHGSHK
jgi:hypothetical protein